LIALGAISAGYLFVSMADSQTSSDQSNRVLVSLPIAEKAPQTKTLAKIPTETPAEMPITSSPPTAIAPKSAIFPDVRDREAPDIAPELETAPEAVKPRAYEESLPTEVYVSAPPPPPPAPKSPPTTQNRPEMVHSAAPVTSENEETQATDTTVENPPTPRDKPAATSVQEPASTQPKETLLQAPINSSRPLVVIVIDDMGVDRRRSRRIIALPGPLTVSYLTYADNLNSQTAAAQSAGHELLLHLPMEPRDYQIDPGPNVLLRDIEPDELRRRLRWGMDRFVGYVGVNNHMGSKFTADRASMGILMTELKRRNVFFLDSRTTSLTVGPELARQHGVPVLERNIFLDNENNAAAVTARLTETEHLARRQGFAIAIGHPRDGTLEALEPWLSSLSGKGIDLVPLSRILARSRAAEVAEK